MSDKLYYSLSDVRSEVYQNQVCMATLQTMAKTNKIPTIRVMSRIFVPRWWVEQQIKIATGENSSENDASDKQ